MPSLRDGDAEFDLLVFENLGEGLASRAHPLLQGTADTVESAPQLAFTAQTAATCLHEAMSERTFRPLRTELGLAKSPRTRGARWLERSTGAAEDENRDGRGHINDALQQGGSIHVADEDVQDPARPTVLGKQPRGIPQRAIEKIDKPGTCQLLDGLCGKPSGQQRHEHAGDGKKMPDGQGS